MRKSHILFTLAAVVLGLVPGVARAQLNVPAGIDTWKTSSCQINFGAGPITPIPAGFFDPGSDPFIGPIIFEGVPLGLPLGPTDTVVQRQSALLPSPGMGTIPIELVGLSLRSVAPITVTSGMSSSQWDVQLTVQPVPDSTGSAQVLVAGPTGGQFQYQFNFRPLFIFTPVGGGPGLQFTIPLLPLNAAAPAQWFTNPPGLPYPGAGPNFFPIPIAMMNLSGAGGNYSHVIMPTYQPDCNANGIGDAQDILSGASYDANGNAIPDECEAVVSLHQMSWQNFFGGYVSRYSNFGRIVVSVVDPPDDGLVWFNAVVDGNWVVQNWPLIQHQNGGVMSERSVEFDLRNVPGVQVTSANLHWRMTTSPLNAPPPGPPAISPVAEFPGAYGTEYINVPIANELWVPTNPIDFINPPIAVVWEQTKRENVPMQAEANMHCAPGARARSLAWMNDTYCLGFGAMCDSAQELYDLLRDPTHMMTDVSGTMPGTGTDRAKVKSGLEKIIMDKMLQNHLTVMDIDPATPDDFFNAVAQGKDVLGRACITTPMGLIYHRFCVVGATRCGTAVTIDIKDDPNQMDANAEGGSHSGKFARGSNSGFGGAATVTSMIVVCPSRYLQWRSLTKYLVGGTPPGGGDSIEGIMSLLDRIAGGHVPTQAERDMLKKWACNARDVACYMKAQLMATGAPPNIIAAADRVKLKIVLLKSDITTWLATGSVTYLNLAIGRLDEELANDLLLIQGYLDCNDNGIDDKQDITNGTSRDINGNGKPDECECLVDWDMNGIVNIGDIFAFLGSWFGGGVDFDGSGASTVGDIFAFIAAWFAGC